jgi:hypothetical protein
MKNLTIISAIILSLALLPTACVTGPDGSTQLDPTAKVFLKGAAKTAALIGLSQAGVSVRELQPFLPDLMRGTAAIFDKSDDPKTIGNDLKNLFSQTAVKIGSNELDAILMAYVTTELIPAIPAASATGMEQFQFNKAVTDQF